MSCSRGILAAALSIACANPGLAWTTFVNGTRPGANGARAVATDAAGSAFIAGQLTTATGRDFAVLKLSGPVEAWRFTWNGAANGEDGADVVALDPNGNAIAAGTSYVAEGHVQWVVFKLDPQTGGPVWRAAIDDYGEHTALDPPRVVAIAVDSSGDVLVGGALAASDVREPVVVKLSGASGAELWRASLAPGESSTLALSVTPDGDVLVGGDTTASRLAGATGAAQWTTVVAGRTTAIAFDASAVAVDVSGDGMGNAIAARLDADTGVPLWSVAVNELSPFGHPAADSDLLVAGHRPNLLFGGPGELVARLAAATGAVVWRRRLGVGRLVGTANAPVFLSPVYTIGLDPGTGNDAWVLPLVIPPEGGEVSAGAVAAFGRAWAVGTAVNAAAGRRLFAAQMQTSDGTLIARHDVSGGGFDSEDVGSVVTLAPDGDIVVGGVTQSDPGRAAFTIVRLDAPRGRERWRYVFDEQPVDRVRAIVSDSDGNTLAAGGASESNIVVKLDADGHEHWRTADVGPVAGIAIGPGDAAYLASGGIAAPGATDMGVVALSRDGMLRWRGSSPGGGIYNFPVTVAVGPDGHPIFVGLGDVEDMGFVTKFASEDGRVLWSHSLLGQSGDDTILRAVAIDPSTGDFVGAGYHPTRLGSFERATLVRLSGADGGELWHRDLGDEATSDAMTAVRIDSDGSVFTAGRKAGAVFAARLAGDGTIAWTHSFDLTAASDDPPAAANDVAVRMALGTDGDPVIAATTAPAGYLRGGDVVVAKLDRATGDERWRRVYDGAARPSPDRVGSIVVDSENAAAVVGSLSNPGTGSDMTVVRLSTAGDDVPCLERFDGDPRCASCSAGCDDGDPCTRDACAGDGFCTVSVRVGDDARDCAFETPLACPNERVPRRVKATMRKAGRLVRRAIQAGPGTKATRSVARATRLLDAVLARLDRATSGRRPLSVACASRLALRVTDAKARTAAVAP